MKLDWRRGILYLAIIGIEGCWLYALITLLNKRVTNDLLSVYPILLLGPISFGLNHLLRRLRWPEIGRRICCWTAWLVAMLFLAKVQLFSGLAWSDTAWLLKVPQAITEVIYTFKPELLVLISTGIIWWLGRRLAYLKIGFTTLVSEFQFGLLVLVITFFIASEIEVDLAHPVYLIAAFFLFSLPGISIGHALEGTSWLSGLRQGHWSGLLVISVSLVFILGFLISLIVTPDLLHLFLAALKWLWTLIHNIIAFLASLFPSQEPTELPPMSTMPGLESPETTLSFTIPEPLRSGLRIGWYLLFIGLFLLAMWRISSDIFKWLRRKLADMSGAEFEPLPGAFRADFLGLLKRIRHSLFGLLRLFHRRRAAQIIPEIASVRQIYRQFLHWAAAKGFPRQPSQTPHEYLYQMTGLLPEAHGDLDFITQQYTRSRYGARRLTEDELLQLKQSWYNVKRHRPRKSR